MFGDSVWLMLIILPLFIGAVTRTSGWIILFARGGMLDIAGRLFHAGHIDIIFTENAVIAGIVSINLPFTILTLQSVFEAIDPCLQEAAATMGATPARSFRRVVLPLALPGVLIAAVLCFILCMNAFATPVLLGGPRLAFILMATTLGLAGLANFMIPSRFRAGAR